MVGAAFSRTLRAGWRSKGGSDVFSTSLIRGAARASLLGLVGAILLIAATAAPARAGDRDLISFSGAYFDVIHRVKPAFAGSVEYRWSDRYWIFKPFVGAMADSDAGGYIYSGVLIDLYFGRHIVVTPSFAPGIYMRGHGKDLGYPLEFRSQIEVSYRFDNHTRLGLSFSHMSNASIGHKNPGVESLTLTYVIPVDMLFGNW